MNSIILNWNNVEKRKEIFYLSLTFISLCAVIYIYCVTTTIHNVVAKKNMALNKDNLTEKISNKEFNLISLKNKITQEYARSLGFNESKEKVFITPISISYISKTIRE